MVDDEATKVAKAFLRAAGPKTCSKCGRVMEPKQTTSQGIINAASFARLVRANFDARPADIPGSIASKSARKRRAAAEAAEVKKKAGK